MPSLHQSTRYTSPVLSHAPVQSTGSSQKSPLNRPHQLLVQHCELLFRITHTAATARLATKQPSLSDALSRAYKTVKIICLNASLTFSLPLKHRINPHIKTSLMTRRFTATPGNSAWRNTMNTTNFLNKNDKNSKNSVKPLTSHQPC